MAEPLFSKEEIEAYTARTKALQERQRAQEISWEEYYKEGKAIDRAHLFEMAKRVQARSEEFLDALIIIVGSRGSKYVEFGAAFAQSDSKDVKEAVQLFDTPESRRALYTILRALTEVPKSWAKSAFIRFLRGTGKQKGAKYHGAGTFGVNYGWKEQQVEAICNVIADWDARYSQMLMQYADVAEEIREEDPDFEVVDSQATFAATRVERDVDFLNALCGILEQRGLCPVPKPADQKPKKERKPKTFKPGDIILKRTLRDLPLPAHVRIPIERHDKKTNQWLDSTMEQVVIQLYDGGYYLSALVDAKGENAYPEYGGLLDQRSKDWLDGATFLGPWKGEINKTKRLKVSFHYRLKRDW
ncbi:MAG: hypothetical protein ABIG71_00280 [Candidatus Uhrbacteria bacterium]